MGDDETKMAEKEVAKTGQSAMWQACPVCGGRGSLPCGFYGVQGPDTAAERCRTCNGKTIIERPPSPQFRPGRPGEWAWIAAGLDPYHAVNLREALRIVPDTGDWHGSLRAACEIALEGHPEAKPNQTATQMRKRARASIYIEDRDV